MKPLNTQTSNHSIVNQIATHRPPSANKLKNSGLLALLLAISVTLLTACGGGGGSTNTSPSYRTLATMTTHPEVATSPFAGTAIRSLTNGNEPALLSLAGEITHASTQPLAISLRVSGLTPNDPTDVSTLDLLDPSDKIDGLTGTYEYVSSYGYTGRIDNTQTMYDVFGVGGIVTRTEDVPTASTATYMGQAVTEIGGGDYTGVSMVIADFGESTVDVTMMVTDAIGSAPTTAAPIDTISITGMVIDESSRNTFSGGDLATTLNGVAVDVTGDSTATTAGGHFFGYDTENNIPDEVAGVLHSTGDAGTIRAVFIAD